MNKTEEWMKIRSIMILNGCSPLYIELARDEFFKEDKKDNEEHQEQGFKKCSCSIGYNPECQWEGHNRA
jgi:hypothetical protein